jgi:hypothetical protein
MKMTVILTPNILVKTHSRNPNEKYIQSVSIDGKDVGKWDLDPTLALSMLAGYK